MEESYRDARWDCPEDFMSYDNFKRVVMQLDFQSSPGIPYCREAPTNGGWLKWDGFHVSEFRLAELWFHVQQVFDGEWDMQLRVFIKQEPHKIAKAELNRWRLIVAAPLAVQVAWHMVFDYQNDIEIRKVMSIPSQQGFVLIGGGWKQLVSQWRQLGLDAGQDMSGWDWTFSWWALKLELEFRFRQCDRGPRMLWYEKAKMLYEGMFCNVRWVLSDGTIWRQVKPGLMKSGCVNTISANSHGQIIYHLAASVLDGFNPFPLPRCVGDDQLKKRTQRISDETARRLGIIVKPLEEGLMFVGHDFAGQAPVPVYWKKHLVCILKQQEDYLEETFDSYLRLYVHSDMYDFWRNLALVHCPRGRFMSRSAMRWWYDYSD